MRVALPRRCRSVASPSYDCVQQLMMLAESVWSSEKSDRFIKLDFILPRCAGVTRYQSPMTRLSIILGMLVLTLSRT